MKQLQSYSQRRAKHIAHFLNPDHEAVKCLVAFGENTLKYAAEVLATTELGTQHRKLQESFPVPHMLRWLRMPELIQTTMPALTIQCRWDPQLSPQASHWP